MQLSNKILYLSSANISLKVSFENPGVAKRVLNNDFINKYIPGFFVSPKGNFDASIEFFNKGFYFDFDGYPSVKIGVNGMSEKDLISLIELIFERARQEKGIYCIHSACAIYRGKAVIFWGGASGMGKTRLARLLAKDGVFYSDEKTLVDANTMNVLGGTPFLYLDKEFWKERIVDQNVDSYYQMDSHCSNNFPIKLFVYGFGIDGSEESTELWKPEKFEWHLYEELGRKIRAISRRVVDGSVSVPSIDNNENGDKRIRYVREVSQKIPCYSLQGSPESIVEYIKGLDIWQQ